MYLIVGLGNPGLKYKYTRHNVGYMVMDRVAKRENIRLKNIFKYRAKIFRGVIDKKYVILAKPTTFMNLSGESVKKIVDNNQISLDNILVIYDDVDLNLGRIIYRLSGSSAGHKGMQSIIDVFDTDKIRRLRIGIGRPSIEEMSIVDYVLSPFKDEEKMIIEEALGKAADFCFDWLKYDDQYLMSKYNRN